MPWTIYAIGLIMKSYFSKWMLGFSDLKKIINVDITWFHDTTSRSLFIVATMVIPVSLAYFLVTLIV